MFRCYCDICGADITDYRAERAEAQAGRLRISVMTAIDNVWNGGHVCLDCIKIACTVLSVPRQEQFPGPSGAGGQSEEL